MNSTDHHSFQENRIILRAGTVSMQLLFSCLYSKAVLQTAQEGPDKQKKKIYSPNSNYYFKAEVFLYQLQ